MSLLKELLTKNLVKEYTLPLSLIIVYCNQDTSYINKSYLIDISIF